MDLKKSKLKAPLLLNEDNYELQSLKYKSDKPDDSSRYHKEVMNTELKSVIDEITECKHFMLSIQHLNYTNIEANKYKNNHIDDTERPELVQDNSKENYGLEQDQGSMMVSGYTRQIAIDKEEIESDEDQEELDIIFSPSYRVGSMFIELCDHKNLQLIEPEIIMYIDTEETKSQNSSINNISLMYTG